MFARTERLTLRPGWPEDAPARAAAIAHEAIVRKLASAPWPYRARPMPRPSSSAPREPGDVSLLIFRRTRARIRS